MDKDLNKSLFLSLTSDVVSSYVSQNNVTIEETEKMMERIYKKFIDLSLDEDLDITKPVPAVSIKNSITPDYLICLEDGKKMKMLKRYLKTTYDMTPDQYREKWSLPHEYPMVAPNYAARRSDLAKDMGLGKK